MPETFNVSAPIQPHDANVSAADLPHKTHAMVAAVIKGGQAQLSGLLACTWRPPMACTNTTQYECMAGPKAGQCSGENWVGRAGECEASCVHTALLRLAPYYALWYPGPLAKEFRAKEMRPRYKHDAAKLSLRTRGIDLSLSDVMMSDICKSPGKPATRRDAQLHSPLQTAWMATPL